MTLENSKAYQRQERTKALQDLSRTRLNGPTPHQAPQRERVTKAKVPQGNRGSSGRRKKQRRWVDLLRPDYNMGVPQLMMILEPNVVWDHVVGTCPATGRPVEATYAPGDFFEGWHKAGRKANGVYEGTYWELMGDCDEMIEMLKKMSKAPPLMDEPTLELPESADLPKWEDFKPVLQAMPLAPDVPPVKLPPFLAPILESEVPFIEPNYLSVPEVAENTQEEAIPRFFPPEHLILDPLDIPHFVDLEPPVMPDAPKAPVFGKPKHGHDWTGDRPFQISDPVMKDADKMDIATWHHPPNGLPKLSLLDDLQLDTADLDLEPLPRLELAWECGPEPEPSYASVCTTPRLMSRASSPPRSRPLSAKPSLSTPMSTPPRSRPISASTANSRPISASTANASPGHNPSAMSSVKPLSPAPEQEKWEEVLEIDAGKPRVWLNFEKPFAELPPVFMPPYPELVICNGPEPLPQDFPHGDLETDPDLGRAEEMEVPEWQAPIFRAPQWAPPKEPRPVGFIRGTAPVIVMDVSGTMNPRINGRFLDLKECVCELLEPDGELATAAGAFDVIAFCNASWSWSATHQQRMNLLANSQTFYSGRQAGGKMRPGTAKTKEDNCCCGKLMPTEPELLMDAQNWVAKWPEAVGHTAMLSAFSMADNYWNADCWYLMSDGLADDPSQCLEFIQSRIRNNERVPVIHAVGFFPHNVNDNFEGRRYLKELAALTGGSFQEYDKHLQRIYQEGVGFVNLDPRTVHPADVPEREWVEAQLKAERKRNLRLGIFERLEVTMTRIQAIHQQQRVIPVMKKQKLDLEIIKAEHEASVSHIVERNANLVKFSEDEHAEACVSVQKRNQDKIDAARIAYEEAHARWMQVYDDACATWEEQKAGLEGDRVDAMAALNTIIRSRSGSPSRSRPQSGICRSRPTSARPLIPGRSRPLSAKGGAGDTAGSRPLSARDGAGSTTAGTASHSAMTYNPDKSAAPGSAQRPFSATPARLAAAAAAIEAADPDSLRPAVMGSDTAETPPGQSALTTPREGGSRPQSARSRPTSALRQRAGAEEQTAGLVDIAEDGVMDDWDEYEDDLPPLDLADEQELSRIIHPPEVVEALDQDNAARLSEIRSEWDKLVKETSSRNEKKLELLAKNSSIINEHVDAVIGMYADSFVKDVIFGGAVRETVNDKLQEKARLAYEDALWKVRGENERVARMHTEEVVDKQLKEELHKKLFNEWEVQREEILAKHAEDVIASKKAHAENVVRMKEQYELKQHEITVLNGVRLTEAEGLHQRLTEDVKETNKQLRAEHQEKVKERKAVEARNQSLLSQAREYHKSKLEELGQLNDLQVARAQEEHQALCVRLALEHEEAIVAAKEEYEELKVFMMQHNDSLMEEARKKFQEAIVQAQKDFKELCSSLQEAHLVELERVQKRNHEIWPQVQVARLALLELGRVQAFAEHLKFCANKFQLGINFMPAMPNWDRVVEMQALTESLEKAYPDIEDPGEYPWPDHENKGKVGSGWMASPAPMPLTLKDPAEQIMRVANGLDVPRPRSASSQSLNSPRQKSEPLLLTPGQIAQQEIQQALQAQWANARTAHTATSANDFESNQRVRFSNLAGRPQSASALPARPHTASPSGHARAGSFSTRTPAPGSPSSRPQTASPYYLNQTASPSGRNSPSEGLTKYDSASDLNSVEQPPTPKRAAANKRPTSASPYLGYGASHPDPSKRPLSSRALQRPSTGRQNLPARLSIDMSNMYGAMSRVKSLGGNTARGGVRSESPMRKSTGQFFTTDLPRQQYAEIDITAVDI